MLKSSDRKSYKKLKLAIESIKPQKLKNLNAEQWNACKTGIDKIYSDPFNVPILVKRLHKLHFGVKLRDMVAIPIVVGLFVSVITISTEVLPSNSSDMTSSASVSQPNSSGITSSASVSQPNSSGITSSASVSQSNSSGITSSTSESPSNSIRWLAFFFTIAIAIIASLAYLYFMVYKMSRYIDETVDRYEKDVIENKLRNEYNIEMLCHNVDKKTKEGSNTYLTLENGDKKLKYMLVEEINNIYKDGR